MIDRIIICGDSFTFGHGCHDRIYYYDQILKKQIGDIAPFDACIPSEYCWAALLQKKYPEIEIVNLARPGHSNLGIFSDLINYFKKNPVKKTDLAILNFTFPDRIQIPDFKNADSTIPWCIGWEFANWNDEDPKYYSEWKQAKYLYGKYLINDAVTNTYALSSMLGAYAFAHLNDIKYFWSYPKFIYKTDTTSTLDLMNDKRIHHICKFDFEGRGIVESEFNHTCVGPDFHVNDKGHVIYLYKEILPLLNKII